MEPKVDACPSPRGVHRGIMDKFPSALADVVEPLREADEYTRLQAIRQRGLYNLLTGLPFFFFVLPVFVPWVSINVGASSWVVATYLVFTGTRWTLFGISCYPQLFMPWVRRHRPDWQSPLIEASLLKRALEKHFWLQFLFEALYISTFFLWFFGIQWQWPGPSLLVAASVLLAWQARRLHDRPLQWTFLAMAPLAGVLAITEPTRTGQLVFDLAITAPPLLLAVVRLLAPRRWLLK